MKLLRRNDHGVKICRLLKDFFLKYYLFTAIITIARDEEKSMEKRHNFMVYLATLSQQQTMINDASNQTIKVTVTQLAAIDYCYPENPFVCLYQLEQLQDLNYGEMENLCM